ncbi:hypothetical protein [Catenuloplanes atrovinosus]|uniref:Uncharacterized protein n=1 Tax=Catenuloplanes atrovinosus TaxID=137266 RepID=A0AAE3YNT3_9ACTN|nr:hypothetical protein [Catenuloplanes atrovinosus]MDR7277238.1 hypothetical protein [Catenuloplanes atrovinosus]
MATGSRAYQVSRSGPGMAEGLADFRLARYQYILQQLSAANENVYRFMGVYQALASTLTGGILAIFVGYRSWGIDPGTARSGIIALLCLVTIVAAFSVLMVSIGVMSWFHYRSEECRLLDEAVGPGFRHPPSLRNFYRWYETYVVAFIVVTVVALWVLVETLLLPAV